MLREAKEWVLKAILTRYPAATRDALERFLPESERKRLLDLPSSKVDTEADEPPLLERVHWSWLLPHFESMNVKEQKIFLSALPQTLKENLARELKIKPSTHEMSRVVVDFVLGELSKSLAGDPVQLLPVYFLPESPLKQLLHLKKPELILLIDLLSMNDLAASLRQIVETKILKKIYSFLSEEEKRSLKKAALAKQPFSTTRFSLEKWDGKEESFRLGLHKKGLARLGAALSAEHPDFIWYVCHELDIGRGKSLMKLAKVEASKTAAHATRVQVEEALREMK
jgi:hypothetical protein